jgi:hypothetical protein
MAVIDGHSTQTIRLPAGGKSIQLAPHDVAVTEVARK